MRGRQSDNDASTGPRQSVGPGPLSAAQQQQQRRRPTTADHGEKTTTTMGGLLDAVADGLRDRTKPWHPLAEWAETRTGVDRRKLFAAAALALVLYLLKDGPGSTALGDAVAFLYPAYATAAAAAGPTTSAASRRRWLTYWTTLVAVLAAERLSGPLPGLVPGYALVRSAFFAWCYAPGGGVNGADFVHATVVRRLRRAAADRRTDRRARPDRL